MKLSIAMATYNGAAYLQDQLDSFLDQTRLPDELVISDDSSTDGTLHIIRAFAANAPFNVKYSQNEKNLGYAANFNAALLQTTGDLVFLSDQDDVWFPEKIAIMAKLAEEKPQALVLMNDAELTDSFLRPAGLTKLAQLRAAGFPDSSFVMGCCASIRRELLDLSLPVPSGYRAHDDWLIGIADALETKIIHEQPLQFYRRHRTNQSKNLSSILKPISRWTVRKESFLKIFQTSNGLKMDEKLFQLTIYIATIEKLLATADHRYALKLSTHLKDKRNLLMLSYKRKSLREAPFLYRVAGIYTLWRTGQYKKASNAKSALRDLIG